MNRVLCLLIMFFLLLLLGSCIKEDMEECPIQYTIKVYVEDKQYVNIEEVPQLDKKDETFPFRDFVGTLYYVLSNKSTGTTVFASSFTPVIDDKQEYTIILNNIPEGVYDFTVWGNVTEDILSGNLHPGGVEHTDLYMGSMQLQFDLSSKTADLNMKRAKGNFVLLCNNFPSNITHVEEKISSVYQTLDPYFNYSGEVSVSKTADILPVNQFFIAPTVEGKTSKVNLRFYDPNGSDNLQLPELNLPISRNKISVISVDYKTEMQIWEIWIYIDGNWTLIHQLDI